MVLNGEIYSCAAVNSGVSSGYILGLLLVLLL